MVIILGIVLVVVVLFGTAFTLVFLMEHNNGTQIVANGDYIRYGVTYYGNSDPVQGYVNMSVSNVKLSGYDITIEYTGFDIPTETKHFTGIGVLATLDGLGDMQADNPTHQISILNP